MSGCAHSGTLFSDVTERAGLADAGNERGIAWGDFDDDGDGDLDLYVARVGPNALFLNGGDGTFAEVSGEAGVDDPSVSWGLALGDHDRNGTLDIYVVNFDIPPNRLYSNNGDGTFTDVASTARVSDLGHGASATWCDFDSDGDPDLYLANKDGANRLFRNNGQGVFTDIADSSGTQDGRDSIATIWADGDNDGDLDLYLSSNMAGNRFFANQGDGTFQPADERADFGSPGSHRGLASGDFDLDGNLDLYIAKSIGTNILLRNNGDGILDDATENSGVGDPESGTTAAWADYDQDGDLDLFLSNFAGHMRLFENTQSSSNHWLAIRLEAPAPNTRAVGARIQIHAGNKTWTRINNTGGGYQSQSPYQLHFGLGATTKVDSVVVRWPSGESQNFGPVNLDQAITLHR